MLFCAGMKIEMGSLVNNFRGIVRRIIPANVRQLAYQYSSRTWDAKYRGRPSTEVFAAIYRDHKWGRDPEGGHSSGLGSRDPSIVDPYVNAVTKFLATLPSKPSVVDLGCGDFRVGRQLRASCGRYVACDIVPALIESHKRVYADLDVDFRCLNVVTDDFPAGEVVFIRQVLQHLSNADIRQILLKIYRYKFLVLTEHLPVDPNFVPNRDIASGYQTRMQHDSGVVLTTEPFNLKIKSHTMLCEVLLGALPGLVRTTVYELGS